jgi:hypothetical protein
VGRGNNPEIHRITIRVSILCDELDQTVPVPDSVPAVNGNKCNPISLET